MSALQHAAAATEVEAFLACCEDVVRKGTQTLSVRSVAHHLNHLETEWSKVLAQTQISVSARVQALQHYHDVYTVCARTVPLAQGAWDRWATGITSSFPVVDALRSSQVRLETLRTELLTKYWGLFCRLYWGCARVAKPRLALVVAEAQAATATAAAATHPNGNATTDSTAGTYDVAAVERGLAAPLHAFAALAFDMSHLFGDFGVVGAVERQWLCEDVLGELGDAAEGAVESLVRRSFKRDLQIPSASLPALLREYEESEVAERKTKEIVTLGQKTLQSAWMRAATALHQYLVDLSAASATATETSSYVNDKVLCDDRAYELLEELLKELRRVPHSSGSLPALGLLTYRVVEWQPLLAAAAPSQRSPGLNGSQTQFYLLLLHQWFARYISTQHRWSVTDLFNATDDSDLWSFVLDRHTFCLMWALSTFERDEDGHPEHMEDAQKHFMVEMEAKIDKLRSILYSVAHCLQLYRASITTYTNPEKRTVRLATACKLVQEWMSRVGASTFCRGLLGDLLDTAEEWEDGNAQTPALQLWTLCAEGELKLIMYDTMQLLGCPDNTTDRLETVVGVALDLCASWREILTDGAGDEASAVSPSLFAPVVTLVIRAVHRIRTKLERSVAPASALSSADVELYVKLVEWLKKLFAVAGAFVKPEALHPAWDEYVYLVSLPAPSAAVAEGGDGAASGTAVIPGFMSYAAPTAKRAFGAASSANGGLEDICWLRRNTFKSRCSVGEEGLKRKHSTPAPLVDESEAKEPPSAKRARTE
ncbi:hypothetical protein ABL78_0032 [Leptomonas seymouri]|uniref:Uncharacterized protein n=1 Tax=Leptomonas seymouri TaxID=5684 RepID=A0A0N0P980_LEPSE|nr:hypothetical protein ABL78_0032 [Leptomonas seymouri]|eukprot:KPI90799.1 hypothetical protein ABL78_0032 [Leptomonas seymouri]